MEVPEYQELLELLSTAFPGQEPTEQQQRLLEMSGNEAFAAGFMGAIRTFRNIGAYPVEEARRILAGAIVTTLLLMLASEHPENSREASEGEESDVGSNSSSEGTGL